MSIIKATLVAVSLSFAATAAFADASVPVQDAPVLKQNSQISSNARAAFASTQAAPKTSTQTQADVLFTREYMESHSGH